MKRRSLFALGLWAGAAPLRAQGRPLSVGVLPGPHAEIMAVVARVARDAGLDLRLVERPGGQRVNADVAAGTLDVACFQDGVSFEAEATRRPGVLTDVARTVTLPFALYSRRVASPRQLPHGATLAIPVERGAQSRALVLLHNHGLVQLRDGSGLTSTVRDVVVNRYAFQLRPRPQDTLVDRLRQVDAAVFGFPQAARAQLQPGRDSIGLEDARSPWSDVLAVRTRDRGAPWVASLITAYRSEPVKRFILERFQDAVRRPW